jgi:hypothetical protein
MERYCRIVLRLELTMECRVIVLLNSLALIQTILDDQVPNQQSFPIQQDQRWHRWKCDEKNELKCIQRF